MSESTKPEEPEQSDGVEEPEVEGHSQDEGGEETPWCGICNVTT
ncbi:hypothetical protein [Streptomyces sp. NRRL F-5123]|nr:hypothetical protein [Streptomyces sp. NRRL F-5123]